MIVFLLLFPLPFFFCGSILSFIVLFFIICIVVVAVAAAAVIVVFEASHHPMLTQTLTTEVRQHLLGKLWHRAPRPTLGDHQKRGLVLISSHAPLLA